MKKSHLRVIKDIQDRIPKHLLAGLMKKEKQAPAIRKVYEEGLKKPDSEVSPKMKRRIRAVLDSGMLDVEVEVLDVEVEKQIDAFMKVEIDKAVQLGRLPKEAPKLDLLNNKGKQYVRRQSKRLKAEFMGQNSDVVPGTEDDQEDQSQHQARPDDGGVLHGSGQPAGVEGGTGEDRPEGSAT